MGVRLSLYTLLKARRTQLAATYLIIIVVLTAVFSFVLYTTSDSHFSRFAPMSQQTIPGPQDIQRSDIFAERRAEVRGALIGDLIWLNIAVLIFGALFSYYLAGLTLEPIEAAMRTQSQFISDASHELRTPLATLQTSNEVALRTIKKLPHDLRQLIESNIAQTEKLRSLTDGLLGLIKAENSQLKISSYVLIDMIDEAVAIIEPVAASKGIIVKKTIDDVKVLTDRASLCRIVRIFMDNAVKYSPAGSTIEIKTHLQASYVELSVTDQGIGIAKDDIDKIFTRFYRIDESRSTQHVEGYGLGLSIAKVLSTQLNLQLHVKSTVQEGSTFSVIVPLA